MNVFSCIIFGSLVLALTACGEKSTSELPDNQPKGSEIESDSSTSDEILTPPVAQPPVLEKMTNKSALENKTEQKIIDLVWKLKEVIELDATIRKKTNEQRVLSTFISSEPSDDQEYYAVSVAEDNGASYATYFQFHVYPDFSIRFYDVVEDQERSLKEWRESKK